MGVSPVTGGMGVPPVTDWESRTGGTGVSPVHIANSEASCGIEIFNYGHAQTALTPPLHHFSTERAAFADADLRRF